MPLARIHGLEQLRLDFSDIPAEFALNCLGWYALYLPPIRVAVAIEIIVPRALELWDNQDPSAQFCQLVAQTRARDGEEEVVSQSTLTVRGFPCSLPEYVQESGSALVCGYRVAFVPSNDANGLETGFEL